MKNGHPEIYFQFFIHNDSQHICLFIKILCMIQGKIFYYNYLWLTVLNMASFISSLSM